MSKKLIFGTILTFVGAFGFQFDASAQQCSLTTCSSVGDNNGTPYCVDAGWENSFPYNNSLNCNNSICRYFLYNGFKIGVCTCNSCPSGTVLKNYTYSDISQIPGNCDNLNIKMCNSCASGTWSNGGTATSCTPCASNTYGGGGDSSSCKSCPTNATCNGSGTFTCKAGYYKNTAGTGCTQCPLADGVYTNSARTNTYRARYTSTAGAKSINDCYLPSGTTYYDAKGTFTFDTTCNYE